MKKYNAYIIGGVFLLTGIAVGWILKASTSTAGGPPHNHEHVNNKESESKEEIWTCSMHPQIRQNEPGICPICEMDLITLDNTMENDDPTVLRMSKEAVKLAQIETFIVGGNFQNDVRPNQSISETISVDGTIEMDERSIKSQTAHLNGRVDQMMVTFEGQYVDKGQKIATIYSTDLLAASQELITAIQYNERVEGLKDAAVQKLKNWKLTDAQIQQIIATNKPIETIDIYADHAGYVLEKKKSQGDYVKQGQSLFTLGSTRRLWLIFNVFESDLAGVRMGNSVVFNTPSIPNQDFYSRITYIDPLLDNNSRTAIVRAEIMNSNNQLKPGMLLKGSISLDQPKAAKDKEDQIKIPNSAIMWTGERSVIYVQVKDSEVPTFKFREIEIEKRMGEHSIVRSGLEIDEEVVVQGAFVVDAAAQLNNNYSMMNREVKVKKSSSSDIVPSYVEQTADEFKQQLEQSILKYLEVKNALVNTDFNMASLNADLLLKAIGNIDMTYLEGDAHLYWMDQLNAIESHGQKIKNASDIEEQRNQFEYLTTAMIKSIKAFGTNDKTYYIQYCPMAKNNQGADWISSENEIKNPYFGDKMMKCGSVKLELN